MVHYESNRTNIKIHIRDYQKQSKRLPVACLRQLFPLILGLGSFYYNSSNLDEN